ncbi:MAG: hypothetical protein M1820_008360 [Bogoriella megaspora]|nr:MAG: hypothetical protein M1820_008360 [Bogoriella megaspora]
MSKRPGEDLGSEPGKKGKTTNMGPPPLPQDPTTFAGAYKAPGLGSSTGGSSADFRNIQPSAEDQRLGDQIERQLENNPKTKEINSIMQGVDKFNKEKKAKAAAAAQTSSQSSSGGTSESSK